MPKSILSSVQSTEPDERGGGVRQRGQRETEGCVYRGEVDQTGVVEVLEQSHVVEEDKKKKKEAGIAADILEEALTKGLPYTKTFP